MPRAARKRSPDHSDPLLTVEQVCDILRISRSTVYTMIQRGELPCVHIGRMVRLLSSDVRAFVLMHAEKGKKRKAARQSGN